MASEQKCSRGSGSAWASLKKQVGVSLPAAQRRKFSVSQAVSSGFLGKTPPQTQIPRKSKRGLPPCPDIGATTVVSREKMTSFARFWAWFAYSLAYCRRGSKFSSMPSGREPACVFRANSSSAAPLHPRSDSSASGSWASFHNGSSTLVAPGRERRGRRM